MSLLMGSDFAKLSSRFRDLGCLACQGVRTVERPRQGYLFYDAIRGSMIR